MALLPALPEWVELEHKVALILQEQEERGWTFNERAAWELASSLEEELRQISELLQQRHPYILGPEFTPARPNKTRGYVAGAPFTRLIETNPTSRDHIAHILQKHYGWKPTVKTQTGKVQIDETTLSKLNNETASMFLRCLTIKKILGMMSHGVNAWLKLSTNNKIHHHCSVGCATHRMSHKRPNLAQVMSGSDYRKLFTAAPGMVMVGADLAGVELRMLAHYLAKHDGGRYAKILLEDDIHQVNADAIGVSRSLVKNITYGFMYGASNRKLGEIYDPKLAKSKQVAKGKEIRAAYVAAIDGMDKLLAGVAKRAKDGFIKAIDGRRLLLDSDHKALNFLLQGSSAVLAKRWMLINQQTIKEINIEAYQLGFIHDELQFETYPPHVNDLRTSLVHSATAAGEFYNLRCRIDAESSTGETWADTH